MTDSHQELLNRCLEDIGAFSPRELVLILEHCTFYKVSKHGILLEAGQICSSVFFLLKGACYQSRMTDTRENIIELYVDNDCMFNHTSFVSQKPSSETIKAYVDSEVLALTIHSLHQLIAISPAFFQLGKLLQLSSSRTNFFDNRMTPVEKYNYILVNKPKLIQQFPLKYIASYLKITPETLSRVRALP